MLKFRMLSLEAIKEIGLCFPNQKKTLNNSLGTPGNRSSLRKLIEEQKRPKLLEMSVESKRSRRTMEYNL